MCVCSLMCTRMHFLFGFSLHKLVTYPSDTSNLLLLPDGLIIKPQCMLGALSLPI